jgi:hypothetical protein
VTWFLTGTALGLWLFRKAILRQLAPYLPDKTSRHRVLTFLRTNRLIPDHRLKNRPAQRRQEYRLPVNLARVPKAMIDEDDVKLARQAWREFGKA